MNSLQKFASVHASPHNHFAQQRHLVDRHTYKEHRSAALAEWQSLGRAGRAAFARQLREDAAGIISPSGDRFAADR
jgi:hypothetical protein